MITTTAFLNKPIFKHPLSYPHKQIPKKPNFFFGFPGSKPGFPGVWTESMTELVQLSAFRDSGGDREESLGLFEQEGFVDGSNEFASRYMNQGFEATLNRLSKWLVAGIFGAVILWRHDTEAMWAAMGSVLNSVLSVTLKKTLNQERPVDAVRSGPGMPSSHAQSIFFTIPFVVWSIVEWLGGNAVSLILGVFALSFGSYLSWLRVSQQLHTISQVVVGAIVGCVFSIFWFWSWDAVVLEAFSSSLTVRITVIAAAVACCLGFLVYVIRYWFKDDRSIL